MEKPETKDGQRRISLLEFERDLARRREKAGRIDFPRNSGMRRTKSKKILLEMLARLGATW
jgi:hypothetical protein